VRAGIHFPHTPFSAHPTRGVWSCRAVGAALVSRSAQNIRIWLYNGTICGLVT